MEEPARGVARRPEAMERRNYGGALSAGPPGVLADGPEAVTSIIITLLYYVMLCYTYIYTYVYIYIYVYIYV